MAIYGVGLLAISLIIGTLVGQGLGWLVGVRANVGGVGIAMLVLIFASDLLIRRGRFSAVSQQGILFWSAIYIPIVVAMAATQNVYGAIQGGELALVAGGLSTAACFALVPVLDRLHKNA